MLPDLVEEGADGTLSVEYLGLLPVLVEAVQELRAENAALRARIDALSAERAAEWARVDAATFLSADEKRELLGFAARGAAPPPP